MFVVQFTKKKKVQHCSEIQTLHCVSDCWQGFPPHGSQTSPVHRGFQLHPRHNSRSWKTTPTPRPPHHRRCRQVLFPTEQDGAELKRSINKEAAYIQTRVEWSSPLCNRILIDTRMFAERIHVSRRLLEKWKSGRRAHGFFPFGAEWSWKS